MATISGQLTFASTGTQTYDLGVTVTEIDLYGGPRNGTTETTGFLNVGHADANNQFCIAHKDSKSVMLTNRCFKAYDSTGTVVLDVSFTSFSGTNVTFNVNTANTSYPVQLVGR